MKEKREQVLRSVARKNRTWTRVIADELGEEISQAADSTAGQSFGERVKDMIQIFLIAGASGRTVVFQSRVLVCVPSVNTSFSSGNSPSIT